MRTSSRGLFTRCEIMHPIDRCLIIINSMGCLVSDNTTKITLEILNFYGYFMNKLACFVQNKQL